VWRVRGAAPLSLAERRRGLDVVPVEKSEFLQARNREENLVLSPARALVREDPPENGAGGGEVAGPEEKVDAVAERREIALFVPARRVQAERGVQLAPRDVEAPAVESRVRDVVCRVRALEAAPRETFRAADISRASPSSSTPGSSISASARAAPAAS
jgi:hypothetical protein